MTVRVPTYAYGLRVVGIPAWYGQRMPERGTLTCVPGEVRPIDSPAERRTVDALTVDVTDASFVLRAGPGGAFRFDAGPPATLTYSGGGLDEDETAMVVLLGILPLTLPAFGLVPLHGAAVTFDNRSACLILGESGAGKSTTLRGLLGAGATFLADDACAIDEEVRLWPGPPLYSVEDGSSDGGLPKFGGKGVRRPPRCGAEPLPVRHVVLLDRGAPFAAEALRGGEAVRGVMAQHRSKWLLAAGRARPRFEVTTRIASLPVTRIGYAPGVDSPERVAQAILDRVG